MSAKRTFLRSSNGKVEGRRRLMVSANQSKATSVSFASHPD